MKVRDLIEQLYAADPDAEVILQKDAEGNGYSPLADIDIECIYIPQCTWGGDVYSTQWTAEDADMSKSEWKRLLSVVPKCVVLAPVN